MNNFYRKYTMRPFFLGLLLVCVLSPTIAETSDTLTTCYNPIMGDGLLNEYFDELQTRLFVEQDRDYSCDVVLRMLIVPSFTPEKVVTLYRNTTGAIVIEYVEAQDSIWQAVHDRVTDQSSSIGEVFIRELTRRKSLVEAIRKAREVMSNKPRPVTIHTSHAILSPQTATLLHKIWWGMMRETTFFPDSTCLDCTMYLFSGGQGVCSATHSPPTHSLPGEFVEIGYQVAALTRDTMDTDVHEKALYDLAERLFEKLTSQDPALEKHFLKRFGYGFCVFEEPVKE